MRQLIITLFIVVTCIGQAQAQWALPHISVANVRSAPAHASEMSTQALMGTPLKVLGQDGDGWYHVEMPDGYTGYIIDNSLTLIDSVELDRWRESSRLMVVSPVEVKLRADTVAGSPVVSDLVAGDIVEGVKGEGRFSRCILPDGRTGWIESVAVTALDEVYDPSPEAKIVDIASEQTGTPYLWGGLSSKGMDCSGLVKLCYYATGRILRRDASQQALTGIPVDRDSLKCGDLLFFGNDSGRVNHVGISTGGTGFIESSGRVRYSNLEGHKGYLGARRIIGMEDTPGIVRINDHPWYFSVKK